MKKVTASLIIILVFILTGYFGCKKSSDTSSTGKNGNTSDQMSAASTTNNSDVAGVTENSREPDVMFIPTPHEVVSKMLELAQVKNTDVVYDLGCGDGRIVISAAKNFGCKAVGFDIDPQLVEKSRKNADANGVGSLTKIEQKDIFTLDLSGANVITLYLLPELNVKLIPQLEKLKPGSRIVSHDFDMKGIIPDQVITVKESSGYGEHKVYLWTTPLKKEIPDEPKFIRKPDVVFLTTPPVIVDKMLELAKVEKNDLVYDLGCGDGRIVIAAAKKFGCRAVGYDIDPVAVKEARENVKKNNVENLVRIEQKDIFTLDLSQADVIALYILPDMIVRLIPQLEKLKPGSRIVSHNFNMKDVIPPDEIVKVFVDEKNTANDPRTDSVIMDGSPIHYIFLWTTPLKKE